MWRVSYKKKLTTQWLLLVTDTWLQFNEFAFWVRLCDHSNLPFFLLFVLVVIGFNQRTYSVREDAGSVAVSVSVMNGTISQDVIITLSTVPGGSATGGIIVLRSTPPSLPQQELPLSPNRTSWLLFCLFSYDISSNKYGIHLNTLHFVKKCINLASYPGQVALVRVV